MSERSMTGVSRLDRVRNEVVRARLTYWKMDEVTPFNG